MRRHPFPWGAAMAAGNGPVQRALVAGIVATAGVGFWYFVKRVREVG